MLSSMCSFLYIASPQMPQIKWKSLTQQQVGGYVFFAIAVQSN